MNQAWMIEAWGVENLKLESVEPEEVQPGQVRVEIKATSLNYRDLLMVRGHYNPRQPLPLVPCSDAAGVVVETSEGASWKVGDRVMPAFAQTWQSGRLKREHLKSTLGGPLQGTLTQSRVFDSHGLVAIPDGLGFEAAATLGCAPLTAWNALIAHGGLRPGETVLVQGTGGVSIFALQLAHAMGARVAVTSSDDAKLERARELGAEYTINYRTTPEWGREARKWCPEGVDHIIEVGGAGTLAQSLRAVAAGGNIYVIGVLSHDGSLPAFDPTPLLMNNIRMQGIFVGPKAEFEALSAAVSALNLEPVISDRFGFDEAPRAFEHLATGNHFGKIVVSD
ncbi:NAD(P)-dependent alcohol dehydrogenase [Microvenator marinus]|uniref:NAD(P)-dependent alcohol dehydrogenase n=1 Tax=Microvenator marinus TaxID=2600177 RepID=A0A5B8XS73_9DELT|nr:NAD(P)-dependent alcohol dehydrogenase [Microvenator marinus]QED28404.1 NAD(P)-dependent alcohol dehydrogenase [Microvenator marinus]